MIVILAVVLAFNIRSGQKAYSHVGQFNKENEYYAGLALRLNDFILSDKKLRISVDSYLSSDVKTLIAKSDEKYPIRLYWEAVGTHAYPDYTLPARQKSSVAEVTITATPMVGELVSEVGGNITAAETENGLLENGANLDEAMLGNDFWFPLDKYRGEATAMMAIPQGLSVYDTSFAFNQNDGMPFTFFVDKYFRSYSVTIQNTTNDSILITISRTMLERSQTFFIVVILSILGIYVASKCIRAKGTSLDTTIAVVGLFIAIPSIRTAIVPSQIQFPTIVDIVLLVPFILLGLAILKILVWPSRQKA
jgi:hypothetical protein